MLENQLTTTLQCLMHDSARVEDDTVLIKLHSGLDLLFKALEAKCALSWYQKSGVWDFLLWGCSRLHGQCCSAVAALALKCAATLASTEAGFDALKDSEVLNGILSIMPASSHRPSDSHLNGASNGFTANGTQLTGTAGISSESESTETVEHLSTTTSTASQIEPTSNVNGLSSCSDLSEVNSSILHALLTLILAFLDHEPGRQWVEHHEVSRKVLLPCLCYSSVFVQRTAAVGLARVLRSSQQQCELVFPLLTGASSRDPVSVKPSVLVSVMSLLLDDVPLGQCPDWLSEELVSFHHALRERMTSLSASTSLLRALFDIRFRLLAHQHTHQVLHGGSGGAVATGAAALIVRDFPDLIIKDGKQISPSGWARVAALASDWSAALAAADRHAPACDAVGRLAVHLMMLPVSAALRADVAARRDAVLALLRVCVPAGNSDGNLPALQVWLEERAQAGRGADAVAACLRAAAAAVPSLSTQLCGELLQEADWQALLALDMSYVPHSTCADEPTVVATLLLLQALIRRHWELVPVGEVMPSLSDVYSSSHNTKQRAVAVLECVLLCLTPSPVAVRPLPQASSIKLMVEEGLCHTAWEVRDSALQVLTAALQYEEYCPEVCSECVRRSTEALLGCDESFVQVAAAALITAARTRCLPGWDWNAAHAWCVRVCCSADAVAGCESDGVAAAAWTLLLALHARQRCVFSSSEEHSSECTLAALHHAQNYCTADSDTLRLAALQYVSGHITHVLQMSESSSEQGSAVSVERCCKDGSFWCVMRCARDPAARVKEAAVQVCREVQRAVGLRLPHASAGPLLTAQPAPSVAHPELPQTGRLGPVHAPQRTENLLDVTQKISTDATKSLSAAQLEVELKSSTDEDNKTVISKSTSNPRDSESIDEASQTMKRSLKLDTSAAKKLRSDRDMDASAGHPEPMTSNGSDVVRKSTTLGTGGLAISNSSDARVPISVVREARKCSSSISPLEAFDQRAASTEAKLSQLAHDGDNLTSCKADSIGAASDEQQKCAVSTDSVPDSNKVDFILEEVLDFPDLQTLDDLRRCLKSSTSHLLADRRQTPSVSMESFITFLTVNLSETKRDDVQEKKEFCELLEDIQLQVQRQKEDTTEDLSLVFGEPSHLIMDCY